MKIRIESDNTKDCIVFASFTNIKDVLNQLLEAESLLQDLLNSGNSIVIQGDE